MTQACEATEHKGLLCGWASCINPFHGIQLIYFQICAVTRSLLELLVFLQLVVWILTEHSILHGLIQDAVKCSLYQELCLRRKFLWFIRLVISVHIIDIANEVLIESFIHSCQKHTRTIAISEI